MSNPEGSRYGSARRAALKSSEEKNKRLRAETKILRARQKETAEAFNRMAEAMKELAGEVRQLREDKAPKENKPKTFQL